MPQTSSMSWLNVSIFSMLMFISLFILMENLKSFNLAFKKFMHIYSFHIVV